MNNKGVLVVFYWLYDVTQTSMSRRAAAVSRKTAETDINVELLLDIPTISGDGDDPQQQMQQIIEVDTGIGFLDHVSDSEWVEQEV